MRKAELEHAYSPVSRTKRLDLYRRQSQSTFQLYGTISPVLTVQGCFLVILIFFRLQRARDLALPSRSRDIDFVLTEASGGFDVSASIQHGRSASKSCCRGIMVRLEAQWLKMPLAKAAFAQWNGHKADRVGQQVLTRGPSRSR